MNIFFTPFEELLSLCEVTESHENMYFFSSSGSSSSNIVETRFFLSEPQMHPPEFTSSHEVLVHATSFLVVMANNLKNILSII